MPRCPAVILYAARWTRAYLGHLFMPTGGAQVNGRRRWRKWARKVREEDARRSWPPGFIWSFASAGYLRRHNANGYAVPRSLVVAELPAPAFTARSLCGMTESAKKRKAMSSKAPASLAVRWRMFRIGERLRPCPDCPQCSKRCTFLPDRLDKWYVHAKDCPGGCEMGNGRFVEGTPCDASGTLPARERKARR